MAAAAATTTTSPRTGFSPSDSLVITSPSLSASSLSSSGFDFVAVQERLKQTGNASGSNGNSGAAGLPGSESFSDDEIVWSVSESEPDPEGANAGLLSDDDFVVLSRVRSPVRKTGIETTTGTIRVAAATAGGQLSSSDWSLDVPQELMITSAVSENARNGGVLSSDRLTAELAKLSMGDGYTGGGNSGDSSGTRTPVWGDSGLARIRPSAMKEKTKTKGGKKTKKKETKTKEGKKTKKKKKSKGKKITIVAPKAGDSLPSPLAKTISSATIVLSSNTTTTATASLEKANSEILGLTAATLPVAVEPLIIPTSSSPPSDVGTPRAVPKPLKGKKKKHKKSKTAPAVVAKADGEAGNSSQQHIDASEKVSEQTKEPTAYDEAVSYISSYISNPAAHHDRICHLTLLQSLIIELGLLADLTLLPRTITSAKTFVKSRAFLNVKEYIAKRGQGASTVQGLLFPSRKALVKDLNRKKNHASLKWVKQRGLQDLLVTAFHH